MAKYVALLTTFRVYSQLQSCTFQRLAATISETDVAREKWRPQEHFSTVCLQWRTQEIELKSLVLHFSSIVRRMPVTPVRRNIAMPFGNEKLKLCGYRTVKKF